jgi:hypothetical protein
MLPMKNTKLSLWTVPLVLVSIVALVLAAAGGCDSGGNEGDACNPLVLRNPCDDGLTCRAASCSASFCCPANGPSGDPNCNAPGCPPDGGTDEGGAEAGTAGGPSDAGADS